MFTGIREKAAAAGDFDKFRHPIPTGHQRPEPLDCSNARPQTERIGCLAYSRKTLNERSDQFVSLLRSAKCLTNPADIAPDVIEIVRLERKNCWSRSDPTAQRLLQVGRRDRANGALRLSQD